MADFSAKLDPSAFRKMSEVTFGAMRDLAEETREIASDLSPVDIGHNKESIWMGQTQEGQFIVYTDSGYGGYLEIGTERTPAQPYIRPAYQQAKRHAEGK